MKQSSPVPVLKMDTDNAPVRVIILGAGMSGLSCARELLQRGCDVLVVEARARMGGRLKCGDLELDQSTNTNGTATGDNGSSENGDDNNAPATSHPIDLGGALIHGIENNPIHSLTVQMGLETHPISDYCLLLDQNGWPFDPKDDEKLSTLFNECLEETFERAARDKESASSFGELFDAVCKERGVTSPEDSPLLKWLQANLELPSGADFHDLGYTWNDDEPYGFAGAHVAVESSWRAVSERLAEGLDIMYNSQVTSVAVLLPDGTNPASMEPAPLVTSSKSKQREPDADRTTSTPRNDDDFGPRRSRLRKPSPSLSTRALKPVSPTRFSRRLRGDDVSVRRSNRHNKGIIQLLSIDSKSGLSYDDPSLRASRRKRKRTHGTATDSGDDDEAQQRPREPWSTVQVTLENGTVLEADAVVCTVPLGVLKIPVDKPGHISFSPPLPLEKRQAVEQLGCGVLNKCAMSFPVAFWQDSDFLGLAGAQHSYLVLNATKYTDKPILVFMYGGSFASQLEAWTDSEIVNDCLTVLRKICGKDVPLPIDYCVTRWGQEKYSRMAFTYIPPGVDGARQLAAMSDAIYDPALPQKPLIMFAGEHTTPYHPSTIHGAFLSGIREAYRLDLFLEPELNDNMVFEVNEKIYQHTFPVRRVKSSKATKPKEGDSQVVAISPAAANQTQTAPRCRGGTRMSLRKQPRTILDSLSTGIVKKPVATASPTKSRRSARSLSYKKPDEDDSPSLEGERSKQDRKKSIDALEDRILLRSLDSYGRNIDILRSKILPVFGATRRRNAEQIRTRWQALMKRKKPLPAVFTSWLAEIVSSQAPAPETGTTESEPLRRSKREVKVKTTLDFE